MTHAPALPLLALLAQIGPEQSPPVPTLPAPPLLEHHLLENPWPLAVVLVLAALVAAWMFNRQARARHAAVVGGALLLAAAGVAIAAHLVTTTRETLIERTSALVAATARADTAALRDMLAGDVVLRAYFFDAPMPRDTLLANVERYMGREYPVDSHTIDSPRAVIDGRNAARTQVHVVVTSPSATMYNVPVGSWWRIHWRLDKDGAWRVMQVECLQLDGVGSGERVKP